MPWVWPQSWARSVDHRSGRCNCTGRRAAAREVHRSTRARETVLFDGGVVVQTPFRDRNDERTGGEHAGPDHSRRRCGDPAGRGAVRSRASRARPSRRSPRRARWPTANAARVIDAAGKIVMPGGIDPHVHMQHPFMIAGRHDPLHAGARPGRHGRALRRHHHADRLRLRDRRQERARRHRGARRGLRAQELLRLGLPPDAVERAAAHAVRRAGRGDPGRLSDHQDLHHQHLAAPHRAHDRLRRHLGDLQGAGQGGRARRHPRRGQRHRHAHVRQADPRGPRRLREHGRGAQHAVGGPELPPRASGWPRACPAPRST